MAGDRGLAEHIRTRLEEEADLSAAVQNPEPVDPLDVRLFRKPVRQHVKEFACVFGVIGLLFALYWAYTGGELIHVGAISSASLIFAGLGYKAPHLLRPLWKGWMAVGHKLGAVVTFLILTVTWSLLVIPIAILLRIVRKKVMDLRYDPALTTYWEEREAKLHNFQLLERQF